MYGEVIIGREVQPGTTTVVSATEIQGVMLVISENNYVLVVED